MERYLLDSNAFIRAKSAPNLLKREAREVIESPENALFVSAAGLWELSDKACKGKLPEFDLIMQHQPDGLAGALRQSGMYVMPIEIFHIEAAYRLPLVHRDPFDRMMIAQAMTENLTVITADRVFGQYAGLRVLAA